MQRSTLDTWEPLLTTEERKSLAKHAFTASYDRRSTILRQGDEPEFVLYISAGYVQAVSAVTGLIPSIRGPGDVVGELGPVLRQTRSTDVVAMTFVVGMLVPADVWIDFISSHPRALGAHYLALAERFVEEEAIRGEPVKGSEELVIHAIGKLLKTTVGESVDGKVIFRDITQSELGKMADLSRESVSHALRRLNARGLVSTSRGSFIVHDPDEIERLAQSQSGALPAGGSESHVGP